MPNQKPTQDDVFNELRTGLVQFRRNPPLMVKQLLKVDMEDWQEEFMLNVRDHKRVSVRSGHGVGKTSAICWVILWLMMTHFPVKIVVAAPTAPQIQTALWPELSKWYKKLPEPFRDLFVYTNDRFYMRESPEESFVVPRTANKDSPEALQGFHSDNMIFIIDEASGVPDIVFEYGQGSMSTAGSRIIMTGNPTRDSGYFFDAFHADVNQWKTMKVSCHDSSRVSDDYINSIKEKYGISSNVFRVRVLGEFPNDADDTLMPRYIIESAVDRDTAAVIGPVIWGVDVARFGSDRTTLAKRRGNKLLEPIQYWVNKDTMQVANAILDDYNQTPSPLQPSEIYIDVIGIGAGVVDRCKQLGLPAIGVNVAESPSSKDKFVRLRDELWWKAKDWFDSRAVCIPNDEVLISELCTPLYVVTNSGQIQIEKKDQIKKRLKRSPDLADAFCLTFYNTSHHMPRTSYIPTYKANTMNENWIV